MSLTCLECLRHACARRRAERTFLQNNSGSNAKGLSGTAVALLHEGSRGTGGLLSGYVSCANVAKFPGATSEPSNASRPADNSPKCTSFSALRTLLWMSSRPDLRDARTFASTPALAHSLLTSINRCHCPVVNMLIRVCNFRCEILPPRGRANSIRGSNINIFQPRSSCNSSNFAHCSGQRDSEDALHRKGDVLHDQRSRAEHDMKLYLVQRFQSCNNSPLVQLEISARILWNLVVMNDLLIQMENLQLLVDRLVWVVSTQGSDSARASNAVFEPKWLSFCCHSPTIHREPRHTEWIASMIHHSVNSEGLHRSLSVTYTCVDPHVSGKSCAHLGLSQLVLSSTEDV